MTKVEVDVLSLHSPEMSAADMDRLKESIATVGQIVPAVIWRGKLVDGRKHKAACEALGIELKTITLSDADKGIEHVRALNLLRTHYTQSQRAMFAAHLANATRGDGRRERDRSANSQIITVARSAAMTGSVVGTVGQAIEVRKKAIAEVTEAVKRGDLSVYAAHGIAALPVEEWLERAETEVAALKALNEALGITALTRRRELLAAGASRSDPRWTLIVTPVHRQMAIDALGVPRYLGFDLVLKPFLGTLSGGTPNPTNRSVREVLRASLALTGWLSVISTHGKGEE